MKTPLLSPRNKGSVLVVTLVTMLVLFLVSWSAFEYSASTGRNAKRINTRQQALAVGDSALELLYAQFRDGFSKFPGTFGDIAPNRAYFKTYLTGTTPIKVPTGAAFPELAVYFPSVGNFATSRLDQAPTQVFTTYAIEPLEYTGKVAVDGTCDGVVVPTTSGGREAKAYRYLATVDVSLPVAGGPNVTAHLSRVFEFQVKSFLNYAIFANSYLEIHPGPNMTINGPVHTNSGLFVGAGGGTVTFTDTVEGIPQAKTSGTNSPTFDGIYAAPMVVSSGTKQNNSVATDPQHVGVTSATPQGTWANRNSNATPITPLDIKQTSLLPDASKNVKDQWGNAVPTDSNPNNDSYHEMIELPTFPLTTNPDPFSPGDARTSLSTPFDYNHLETLRLSNIADYIITLDNATHDVRQAATITITDSSGATVSTSSDVYKAFVTGLTKNGTVLSKALITGDSFYDAREADSYTNAKMQVTTLDVAALKAAIDKSAIPASSDSGLGIVINDNRLTPAPYVAAIVTTSTDSKGKVTITGTIPAVPKSEPAIRLKNGYVMPDGGLTVVSQNPVYVQGDYNTGGSAATVTTLPLSNKNTGTWNPNSPDPTTVPSPTGLISVGGTNYYWQPAAIVADAINVLSNSWVDTNTKQPLNTTPANAQATTINAAFIAGNVPTTSSNYSGGVENYPRFLENWNSNVRFNYCGSMVILFPSQQATEPWGKSGVYSAPIRNWAYDKNFLTFGVPLLASGGSGPGGMAGGGSRKTIAGGGAKMYFRKQWISRTVQ